MGRKQAAWPQYLEQFAPAVDEIVEGRHRIRAETGERGQVVRACEDVHRVDLDRTEPRRRGTHVRHTRALRLLRPESERAERQTARVARGELDVYLR